MRMLRIAALVLACGSTGCDGSAPSSALTAPTPVAQPLPSPPIQVVVFTELVSGFATSDVRDAQNQIVRFNTAGELIWVADGTRFPGYAVRGGGGIGDGSMEVAFGTKDGERRAYLVFSMSYHHYGPPASVVDLEVVDGRLTFADAKPPVPLPGS